MSKRKPLTRWWHGGVPGLEPGDRLVPAAELDSGSVLYGIESYAEVANPEFVYITTDKTFARFHAAVYAFTHDGQAGSLYNVRPRGDVEPDPDEPGSSDLRV